MDVEERAIQNERRHRPDETSVVKQFAFRDFLTLGGQEHIQDPTHGKRWLNKTDAQLLFLQLSE